MASAQQMADALKAAAGVQGDEPWAPCGRSGWTQVQLAAARLGVELKVWFEGKKIWVSAESRGLRTKGKDVFRWNGNEVAVSVLLSHLKVRENVRPVKRSEADSSSSPTSAGPEGTPSSAG